MIAVNLVFLEPDFARVKHVLQDREPLDSPQTGGFAVKRPRFGANGDLGPVFLGSIPRARYPLFHLYTESGTDVSGRCCSIYKFG